MTALFGLFGTVALISGPSDITKLPGYARWIVVGAVLLAAIFAGTSIIKSTEAQVDPQKVITNFNPNTYAEWVRGSAATARRELKSAKQTGAIAAALLFGIGLFVLVLGALNKVPA